MEINKLPDKYPVKQTVNKAKLVLTAECKYRSILIAEFAGNIDSLNSLLPDITYLKI
jgi:hypothetical protein